VTEVGSDNELTDSEREFVAALEKLAPYVPQIMEKWQALPRETRLELLAHGQAGLAVLSFVTLGAISDSAKSMAKSSERISEYTRYLIGLSAVLAAETAALILLLVFR
jgi:hypothetical protein